ERIARVWSAEERLAPRADRVLPAPGAIGTLGDRAAVLGADRERSVDRLLDGMVGGLEAQHEQRVRSVAGHRHRRLARVDQPAVGGIQSGLADRANALRPAREARESHAAGTTVNRP